MKTYQQKKYSDPLPLAEYRIIFTTTSHETPDYQYDHGLNVLDSYNVEERLRQALRTIMEHPDMAPFGVLVTNSE